MAISKVALGAVARVTDNVVDEIRLAAASLAPFPTRLYKTETAVAGKALTAEIIESARQALLGEAQPIDDIRSKAEYRRQVGANLLEEFLRSLTTEKSA